MQTKWRVDQVPILTDNFVYIVHNTQVAVVIDPGEAGPVLSYLEKSNLVCEMILITHHHADHIQGVEEIQKAYSCTIYAPQKNQPQLPPIINHFIQEGDLIPFYDLNFKVMELPGHTLGHVAYWVENRKWLFSGDVLFALGCGRLFEGTFQQMFESLQRIKDLADETWVFCTHDYLNRNQEFCKSENLPLQGYHPLFPLSLKQEKQFNPFLTASNLKSFQELREKRNHF